MSDSCDILFLEEERFLQKINYVETEEHAMHHKDLRDNYIGLLKKMLLDDNKLFISAAKYLDPWVINHVLVLDKKYGGFYLAMSK